MLLWVELADKLYNPYLFYCVFCAWQKSLFHIGPERTLIIDYSSRPLGHRDQAGLKTYPGQVNSRQTSDRQILDRPQKVLVPYLSALYALHVLVELDICSSLKYLV